ncbi:AbrB family transcriptional regulator, partial [Pseudomonas cichorii]|nr:AbrB family transcriptional regulator [Pseudomonas cichorii]
MQVLRWVMLSLVSILLALVLKAVGAPAAFMIGAMVSGIFFVVIGSNLVLDKRCSNLAQAVIGAFIGSALHPEFIETQSVPFYICVLVTLSVLGLSIFTGVLVTRIKFLPGSTGLWGTLPGAAPMMIILSEQYGADSRLVAFIQYSRVVLVALIASFVVGNFQAESSPEPWFDLNNTGQIAPVAVVIVSMVLASVMRSPAANFVGAIAIAAVAQFIFKIPMEPPKWLLTLGFVFLGWSVG